MPSRLRPYLPAVLLFATIVATAPFATLLRDAALAVLPSGGGLRRLIVAVGAGLAALAVVAALRIRERRRLRWGALIGLAAVVVAQDRLFGTGLASSDFAEKLHVVEYGLLAALLARPLWGAGDLSLFLRPLLWVGIAGVADEWVQWLAPRRHGEVRDVGLDMLCGVAGLLAAVAWSPPRELRWRLDPDQLRPTAHSAAVFLLALGLFVRTAHLGFWVVDPEVGRFRSWHTSGELRLAAEDRGRRWAASMPTEVPIWGVADRYLAEAADHAMLRNTAWQQGDFPASWRENRILELYYSPFLDILSFQSKAPHRLPDAAREKLERRARRAYPIRSASPVRGRRVATWPSRSQLLAGTVALALLVAAAPELATRRRQRRGDVAAPERLA